MGADPPGIVALFDEIDADKSGDLNHTELQVCVASVLPLQGTFANMKQIRFKRSALRRRLWLPELTRSL